ncbi:NAD(P)H-dependent oxidoreductase, partial [Mesorhizobium sp. M7A.F.Ca.US.002.01.1.1]|uniref:NAD(P)H-dependent oxidoreductase n=1 Tax=Mesorhizobium sp. M7A.F.Ca.US.002.01.1.1 TaxID=2496700 RepID=UPI00269DE4A7
MQEFEHGTVPDELKDAVEAVVWADHILFVFPLWLGTMPAMLKAFLEQVMRPGTAFAYPDKGRLH